MIYPELHQLFCDIVSGKANSFKVDENEHFLAILDIAPMAKGHTLIVPKRAVIELSELTDQEILAMHRMINDVSIRIKSRLDVVGITIMQNGGHCNSISYLHVHVVPRFDTVSIWKDEMFDSTPLADVQESLI